jgi:hypothetical protein
MRRGALCLLMLVALVVCSGLACQRNPANPSEMPLGSGRWTGAAVCLSVADTCNLVVGCGHGQFSRPTLHADGTFDVDGTYRIEVGPISIDPAPPAHFSGVVMGSSLTLTVTPSGSSAAAYSMSPSTEGTCAPRCV